MSGGILDQLLKKICTADITITDITTNNPNVFFEYGIRQDYDAWPGLGGAHRRQGNLKEAIESYEKAYDIKPKSTYAIVNVVALRAARGNKGKKKVKKNYSYSQTVNSSDH